MLCLKRRDGDRILIRVGTIEIWVTVWREEGKSVRVGIEGPREAEVLRGELVKKETSKC